MSNCVNAACTAVRPTFSGTRRLCKQCMSRRNTEYIARRARGEFGLEATVKQAIQRKLANVNMDRRKSGQKPIPASSFWSYGQIKQLYEKQEKCCAICRQQLDWTAKYGVAFDRVIPGRPYSEFSNIQLLCRECNSLKRHHTPATMLLHTKFYYSAFPEFRRGVQALIGRVS